MAAKILSQILKWNIVEFMADDSQHEIKPEDRHPRGRERFEKLLDLACRRAPPKDPRKSSEQGKNIMDKREIEKIKREFAKTWERNLREASDLGLEVEILSPGDPRTCTAVRRYEGKIFSPSNPVPLPVSGCNAEWCRCIYVAVIPEDM